MLVCILYTIVYCYDYSTVEMSIQEILCTIVYRLKEGERHEFF